LSGSRDQPMAENSRPQTASARNPISRSANTAAKLFAPAPARRPTSTTRYASPPMLDGRNRLKNVPIRWLHISDRSGIAMPSAFSSRPHFQELSAVFASSSA